MWKSLFKKKLYSYFGPRRDSNLRTLQNVSFSESGCSTVAATASCSKLGSYTWYDLKTKTKNAWGKRGRGWIFKILTWKCPHFMSTQSKVGQTLPLTYFKNIISHLLKIYFIWEILEVRKFFFSMLKIFFFSIFFLNSCKKPSSKNSN